MKWFRSKKRGVMAAISVSHTFTAEELVESVAAILSDADVPRTKKAIIQRLRTLLWLRGDEYWQCVSVASPEQLQQAEDLCSKFKLLPPEYVGGFWLGDEP